MRDRSPYLSKTKETQNSMAEMPDSIPGSSGRKLRDTGVGASSVTTREENDCRERERLMEVVVERDNMRAAYKRVVRNKGNAGIGGMTVDELKPYLTCEWERIKSELLEDRYIPQVVLQVEIPKGGGGMRKLGIPTVVDRLIGQAIHQVLEPIFDCGFSESSYGFRKGRNAHQAVEQARRYVSEGRRWVVDIDLEKFFDRVKHDILMARVARKVKDKRLLRLIRRYLQAGIMVDGLETARTEGTPQGSPLSPLLSNIMLDDLDKELERRGHAFCRYADDCNIYVRSQHAGERVMRSITGFLKRKLRLKVSRNKSTVDRPWKRKMLGYSITWEWKPRLRVAEEAVKRLKVKLREHLRRGRGRNIEKVIEELNTVLRGWVQYFKLCEVKTHFEELDKWIRRKLRCILWQQWKRSYTRARKLMNRGLEETRAWTSARNGRGAWWNAGASHMNAAYTKLDFDHLGLVSLLDTILKFHNQSRTAVYGTVRTVV
jgi:RNA-directed DNA polymerase